MEKYVMCKSNTYPPNTNVVPFPQNADVQHHAGPMSTSRKQPPATKSRKPKPSRKAQSPAEIELEILAMSCDGNPTPDLVDDIAPSTVRKIVDHAGAVEAGNTRLPRRLQRRLELLCRFKHPAGLILKGWLDGNRRFLPANFQTIADYSACSEETQL
ncbi:hypothetical protein [Hoeflea sp. IMCC20628]|uniref:hypothetical protein n=1 Tax=Hoeflea sp. IMCC20628 TaxID=1620421 RepID=UPI0012E04427|nr:hypothetical protein [Hoeflea sp. IMCC20628]